MRIKLTALVLSAMLPLSVWAMPGEGQQGQNKGQQSMQKKQASQAQNTSKGYSEKMQQRQAAWFDRLELTSEQRKAFQAEMQEHRQQQQKSRMAHHDKLRALLNDKQRATFDAETEKMQHRMHKHMQKSGKNSAMGEGKRTQRNSAQ